MDERTILGSMYELTCRVATIRIKSSKMWTEMYIDDYCDYDPRLTTGNRFVLDVDECDNVFVADWGPYAEECYDRSEIEVRYYGDMLAAEAYLLKTSWEAMMEKLQKDS